MANDYDMLAVQMNSICGPLADQLSKLCECIKEHAQQPGVMPCNSYPMFYRGSVPQTFNCHTATTAFQVPKGQIGTITRVSLMERYPGTLYGANFMLLINDNLAPNFPRVDHNTSGAGTRVCLAEQDIVSVMLQCSWTPISFPNGAASTVQTLFPFEIEGYFEYLSVAA